MTTWTDIERDYDALRMDIDTLDYLGIATAA
jgi:hypothetical protein